MRSSREERIMSEDLVSAIKEAYNRTLEEERKAREEVRMKAYYIGKMKGLLTAMQILEDVLTEVNKEVSGKLASELSVKSSEINSLLYEGNEKRYKEVMREIEVLSAEIKMVDEVLDKVKGRFREESNEELRRIKDSVL